MRLKQTIRLYYALSGISGFGASFFFATYTMFLKAHGMDLLQINMINLCFFVTMLIFEVPTGALADIFGRKPAYVLSCVLLSFSYLTYAVSDQAWEFILAEMIGAVGLNFANGAFEAWMVSRVNDLDPKQLTGPIISRERQLSWTAQLVGVVCGGFLSDINLSIPWLIAGTIQMAIGLVAWRTMIEDKRAKVTLSLRNAAYETRNKILKSITYARKSSSVRFLLVMGMVQAFTLSAPNIQWPMFFSRFLGDSTTKLGFLFAGTAVAMIAGATLTGLVSKYLRRPKMALLLVQSGIAVGIMVCSYATRLPLALTAYLAHEVMRGLYTPLQRDFLNQVVPDDDRATLLSFAAMSSEVGMIGGLVINGLLATRLSMSFSWMASGGLLLIATVWLVNSARKEV